MWVVRHPPVVPEGICYGQWDVPIRMDPASAADAIQTALQQRSPQARFGQVWCSPWTRTRAVADQLAVRWNTVVRVDPRLSELRFGEWEGRAFAEIERTDRERFMQWMHEWRTVAPPGGETLQDLVSRVRSWCAERSSLAGPNPKDVCVITHAGTIRALRVLLRGTDFAKEFARPVEYLVPEFLDHNTAL